MHCGDNCTQHLQKSRIEYLCPAVELHDTNDAGDENPYKIPMLVLIVLFYVEGPEFLHYICLSVGPSVCLSVCLSRLQSASTRRTSNKIKVGPTHFVLLHSRSIVRFCRPFHLGEICYLTILIFVNLSILNLEWSSTSSTWKICVSTVEVSKPINLIKSSKLCHKNSRNRVAVHVTLTGQSRSKMEDLP